MKKYTYTVSSRDWFMELARLRDQLRDGIITYVELDGKRRTITIVA